MNNDDLISFNRATTIANTNSEAAYRTLKELEERNPQDANLLSWLVFIAPTYQEKQRWATRAMVIAPDNPTVQQALDWFQQQPKPEPATIQAAYSPTPFQERAVNSNDYNNSPLATTLRRKVKPDKGSAEALAAQIRRQKWFVPAVIGSIVLGLAAIVGLVFWIISPNYVEYFSADEVLIKADKGTYAKFRIKLNVDEYFSNEGFDFYGWLAANNTSLNSGQAIWSDKRNEPMGLLLKFDRNTPNIRPSGGEATYFVKIGEAYLNSKLVVADVMKVENTLERDIIPVRELPQITIKRVIRTNSHPGLGLSDSQNGRFWLVLDIEVKSPKANPNVTSTSLWSDIRQNTQIVLVNKSGIRDARRWEYADAQPKNTTTDRYYIFTGQIVAEAQADWKEAYFIGNAGHTSFEMPVSLTK